MQPGYRTMISSGTSSRSSRRSLHLVTYLVTYRHLFAQLKADYLHHHKRLAASGCLCNGRSPLTIAGVEGQAGGMRRSRLCYMHMHMYMSMHMYM